MEKTRLRFKISTKSSSESKRRGRGRPRKVLDSQAQEEVHEVVQEVQEPEKTDNHKKQGRKKKLSQTSSLFQLQPKIRKSYIIQLNISTTDLDKIQEQFTEKVRNIGYNDIDNDNHKNPEDLDDYNQLINRLEQPFENKEDQSIPKIPTLYSGTAVPVLPENIPVQLFNETEYLDSDQLVETRTSRIKSFRNTTNLVLPLFKVNGNTWPKKSPYPCWECNSYFDGTPVGIPEKQENGKFYCSGNFCDLTHVARYMKDRMTTSEFWEMYSLLCTLYQIIHKLPPTAVCPLAPKQQARALYGGKLSDEEYFNYHKLDKKIEVYKLPLVPVLLHIEELSKVTNIKKLIERNQNQVVNQVGSFGRRRVNKKKRFIPIDPKKIDSAKRNLMKLKQERIQNNITLHNCFGGGT
jgi:hypothetical protein